MRYPRPGMMMPVLVLAFAGVLLAACTAPSAAFYLSVTFSAIAATQAKEGDLPAVHKGTSKYALGIETRIF